MAVFFYAKQRAVSQENFDLENFNVKFATNTSSVDERSFIRVTDNNDEWIYMFQWKIGLFIRAKFRPSNCRVRSVVILLAPSSPAR